MILLAGALFCQSQKLPSFLLGQICHFIHLGTRQNNLYYFLPASIWGSSRQEVQCLSYAQLQRKTKMCRIKISPNLSKPSISGSFVGSCILQGSLSRGQWGQWGCQGLSCGAGLTPLPSSSDVTQHILCLRITSALWNSWAAQPVAFTGDSSKK